MNTVEVFDRLIYVEVSADVAANIAKVVTPPHAKNVRQIDGKWWVPVAAGHLTIEPASPSRVVRIGATGFEYRVE